MLIRVPACSLLLQRCHQKKPYSNKKSTFFACGLKNYCIFEYQ